MDCAYPLPYSQVARLFPISHTWNHGHNASLFVAACAHMKGLSRAHPQKESCGFLGSPLPSCLRILTVIESLYIPRTIPFFGYCILISFWLECEFLYNNNYCLLSAYYVLNKLSPDALKTSFWSRGSVSHRSQSSDIGQTSAAPLGSAFTCLTSVSPHMGPCAHCRSLHRDDA